MAFSLAFRLNSQTTDINFEEKFIFGDTLQRLKKIQFFFSSFKHTQLEIVCYIAFVVFLIFFENNKNSLFITVNYIITSKGVGYAF